MLAIYPSDVHLYTVHHTLKAHFFSSTTLDVAVLLQSPQIEVCLLCAKAILATTIGVVVNCILRPLFLPGTTLGMPFVSTILRPKSVRCVLGFWVPLAQPSVLLSIFVALRPEFVRCVLRYPLGYNLRHRHPLLPKDLLCTQHDSRLCCLSS